MSQRTFFNPLNNLSSQFIQNGIETVARNEHAVELRGPTNRNIDPNNFFRMCMNAYRQQHYRFGCKSEIFYV